MQPGLSNGQRLWTSSEGNAIWYDSEINHWHAGAINDIGSSNVFMKTFVSDQSQECPNNKSYNWYYWDEVTQSELLDIFKDVIRVQCTQGL